MQDWVWGWTVHPSYGNVLLGVMWIREHVGSVPSNLLEGKVAVIDNFFGDVDLRARGVLTKMRISKTQPWGEVVDFHVFRRTLSVHFFRLLLIQPIPTAPELLDG